MLIALFGIAIGVLVGYFLPISLSTGSSLYMSVAILAAIDTVFGGIRANMEGKFDNVIFITGFFGNSLIAFLLAYIGDQLGVPLYYAAVFVFGTRLFENFSRIRRHIFKRY